MLRKFLLLVLAFSFMGAKASVITVDQPIALSPEQLSQTVNISLDQVPDKLIRKGVLRDGKVKVKVKLSKKDRKKFILDPKNGKVTINIVDGKVQSAPLTITVNEDTELGFYDLKAKASKKFKKSVPSKLIPLEYNNVKSVQGQIDLSNIVTTANLRNGLDPSGLVVELFDFNPATKTIGEMITSTTSDVFGAFNLQMPSSREFGPTNLCQTRLVDDTVLRTFVTQQEPIINAQSDYFVDFITGSDINLVEIPDIDFAAILEQVTRENIIATTVQGVQDKADDIYDPALQKFAEGKKGTAELPGAFKGFTAEFLLGQAFTGNDDENKPIIGQVSGFTAKVEKAKVDSDQDAVFEVPPVSIGQYGVVIIDPINDPEKKGTEFFSPSVKTAKELEAETFVYKAYNPEDNCLLMTTPPLTLDPEKGFFTNKSPVIYDAIFEEEAGLLTGISGDATARDNDGEGDLLSASRVVLPFYVQSTSDLNGGETKDLKRNFAKDLALSTITAIGFMAFSIDYDRLGVKKVISQAAACDAAFTGILVNNCAKEALVELNVSKEGDDQQAAQYVLDANLFVGGIEQTSPFDFGTFDWENADLSEDLGFILSNKAKEKTALKNATGIDADLVIKPFLGNSGEPKTRSDTSFAFKHGDIILTTDFINTDDEAHATVQFIYDMTNSGNGTALTVPTTYKTYGVRYEFNASTSSISGIKGSALVTPSESSNSFSWKIINEAYEKSTSSLNNTDVNNLAPTKSTDSVTNQTVNSVYNAGNSSHIFESIHGTTRQCQFPNDQIFVCQIFSSNALDDTNTNAKSVGIVYGVRVENQPTQD